MSAGLAIPAVIILGCALLAGIVAMATRKKRALWDIFPGPMPKASDAASLEDPVLFDGEAELSDSNDESESVNGKPKLELVGDATDEVPTVVDIARSDHQGLAEWHQRHEQTVSDWIENHQRVLGEINASGLQIDMDDRDELLAGHEELAPKMREAIASHPSPVMRAELSAMHVAGEAAVFAVIKSDYATARRQHLIYVQYRDEWIERLRQFSQSPLTSLRSVMNTDEFELEEIRAALETALFETEEPEEVEPDFEAPIMVREDPESVLDLVVQTDGPLQVAVGTPDDTIEDLEGGRIRRLLRRRGTSEDAE
ncbi:MAG: hypothetical protein OXG30_10145 [bacterium]|nr:hypothetical protein [bacterium]MCY3889696.1 hypothetical protein [bacterium]MCY4135257.1 hypothetical protein [bacterium]